MLLNLLNRGLRKVLLDCTFLYISQNLYESKIFIAGYYNDPNSQTGLLHFVIGIRKL